MVQTYQGYFQEDGQFISGNTLIKLPTLRRTIVNILDDEPVVDQDANNVIHQQRVDRILNIINQAREVESELTDDDWDELTNIRDLTNAGLSRTVEL